MVEGGSFVTDRFVGYMGEFFLWILEIFRGTSVPGFSETSFLQVYAGYFVIGIVIYCLHHLLFGSASFGGGASYRVGRPKKSKKGESSE